MKIPFLNKPASVFFLGVFFSVCIFLFIASISAPPPPNYGRFQLQSWAAAPVDGGALVGAFVIDTATGETKTVYSRLIKSGRESVVLTNQLKKPFIQVK